MNGSRKDLDERVAETQRMLRAMEESLARTTEMIAATRRLLDEALAAGGDTDPDPPHQS
jgi:hypothetical protein